jgi:hypothetical protein
VRTRRGWERVIKMLTVGAAEWTDDAGTKTSHHRHCSDPSHVLTDQRDLCGGLVTVTQLSESFVLFFHLLAIAERLSHGLSLFFLSPPDFANQALYSSHLPFSFHRHRTTSITCYVATFPHLIHTHSTRQENADPERRRFYNSRCV